MCVNGIDLEPLDPVGCPGCGRGRVWRRRIVMDVVDDAGMRVLCALARSALPAPPVAA